VDWCDLWDRVSVAGKKTQQGHGHGAQGEAGDVKPLGQIRDRGECGPCCGQRPEDRGKWVLHGGSIYRAQLEARTICSYFVVDYPGTSP